MGRGQRAANIGLKLAVAAIYAFILAPILVVIFASFSKTAYITFPPNGLTTRWFFEIVTVREFIRAFWFSGWVAVIATAISLAIGGCVGVVLARNEFRGKAALLSFFLSPLLLPELALGIGLLQYFSQIGVIRGGLAIAVAHSIICTPYCVRAIYSTAVRGDESLELCAASLGAAPLRVIRDITIPILKPGFISGGVMAFIVSFDNITISLFLSSPGDITLPALLFNQAAEMGLSTMIAAVCALLIFLTLGIMLVVDRMIGMESFFETALSSKRANAAAT